MVRFEKENLIIELYNRHISPREQLDRLCVALVDVLRAQNEEVVNMCAQEIVLEFLGDIMPVGDNVFKCR